MDINEKDPLFETGNDSEFMRIPKKTQETNISSRLPGFHYLSSQERLKITAKATKLNKYEQCFLNNFNTLTDDLANIFIENAIGTFSLPLGIATNFKLNGKDILIPMAVEESSVIAAASYGAKLARSKGGFITSSSDPIMTGQIQLYIEKESNYDEILTKNKNQLIEYANRGQNRLLQRNGGTKDLTWYYINEINSLIIEVHINTADAMGANIVNTICEKLSPLIGEILPNNSSGLRILTNLSKRRTSKSECIIPAKSLTHRSFSGEEVVKRIHRAWEFAFYDIKRATTHNKGIMNGIDPVVIATGNDWRAVEAAAHASCVKDGQYRPMTSWKITRSGDLHGHLELPIAVGTVGGVTKLHPSAQTALKILQYPNSQQLGEIICSVGLAQNLSALRALACEGIQSGHMALHNKNIDLLNKNAKLL